MSSAFPGHDDALLATLEAIPTRPRVLAALIIIPTPLAAKLDEFRTTAYMYALLATCDTPGARALVVALSNSTSSQQIKVGA